ncbi:MAG: T9SS type A sorting domain-containing protein [Ignavibacteriaceae bacterium]|nr:T9SS type A sorting domain-containing protein [Ignavibacteriaceae bacterium]
MKSLVFILILMIPFIQYGQNEILINSHINNEQRDPQIVTDNNGSLLVVWTSYNQINDSSKEDIFLQFLDTDLNKIGNEIQVNELTEGDQIRPSVAMNTEGDFAIAWASYTDFNSIYDIKVRLYKNGTAASNEFLVNTVTANTQTKPSVDISTDGSFIVVWESWFEDGSDRGIFGQRFSPDGNKNGGQFQINLTTQFSQARPVVKYFPDGKFIVIWESWKQETPVASGYGLFGRLFNSSGEPISNEVQINDYSTDYQWFPDVVTLDSENFVVAWCSWEQDGHDGGIYIKRLNTSWESFKPELLVNSTTSYYQWLPKLAKTPGGNIAVVWSSWLQDGSREGIYTKILDGELNEKSFESRLNDVTQNFQWEPSIVALNDDELIAVWSNYDEIEKSYDIIGKRVNPLSREGIISNEGYSHVEGLTTSMFMVNVIDSTEVTGDTYEISFAENISEELYAIIKNKTTDVVVVPELLLNKGENFFYLTPVFDGVAVEIKPVLTLEIDYNKSLFINNSGTNIQFDIVSPSGTTVIAPIDLVLQWGDASKNPDGTYVSPLDSAYSSSGILEIKIPFIVWDITNNQKMFCFIIEPTATKNKMWDPGESIVILTPTEYQISFPNFHVQLNSTVPLDSIIFPAPGDSNFIYTKRPLTTDDVFTFSTDLQYFTTSINDQDVIPEIFELKQNYPNPFNPSTTISFSIPEDGVVKLKIYNILGQLVSTLKNELMQKGSHRVIFDSSTKGSQIASGVYFYSLEVGNKFIVKKMLLLK